MRDGWSLHLLESTLELNIPISLSLLTQYLVFAHLRLFFIFNRGPKLFLFSLSFEERICWTRLFLLVCLEISVNFNNNFRYCCSPVFFLRCGNPDRTYDISGNYCSSFVGLFVLGRGDLGE